MTAANFTMDTFECINKPQYHWKYLPYYKGTQNRPLYIFLNIKLHSQAKLASLKR